MTELHPGGGSSSDASAHRQDVLAGSLLRSALDAIIVMDETGCVLEFNPMAEQVFGYARSEAVGQSLASLIVPPAMRERHRQGYKRYIATGQTKLIGKRIEVEAMRRDGTLLPVEMTMVEARLDDGERIFAAHLRDLTETRRAMAQAAAQSERLRALEKLSALGTLLGGVAHEINNPLAVVLAQSTLLRERARDPDVVRRAERILAASERCARILKSFMAIARQKAPRQESCSICSVVQDAIDLTAYGRRSAGIELICQTSEQPLAVEVDRDLVGQAVAHLLVFLQNGLAGVSGPVITVATRARAPFAVLEVSDNGPGVPDALVSGLFDAFSALTRSSANTSIGLNIARDAAEAHGGRLSYETSPEGGALFRLFLPLAAEVPRVPAPYTAPIVPMRVLVVDDEADVGRSLGDLLRELGLDVACVESPLDGLAQLERTAYDAVITDLRMPAMDGLTFLQRVRAQHPGLAGRCVLATGDVLAATRQLDVGFPTFVLPKPFTLADVRSMVERISVVQTGP